MLALYRVVVRNELEREVIFLLNIPSYQSMFYTARVLSCVVGLVSCAAVLKY